MSQEFISTRNKQQKHPKVHFKQYLYSAAEPGDSSADLPAELEAELLENGYEMKQRIRRTAQRLRNRFS